MGLRTLLKTVWFRLTGRKRGTAEMKVIRRDVDGRVMQEDYVKTNVTFRLDADGQPMDIRTEDET